MHIRNVLNAQLNVAVCNHMTYCDCMSRSLRNVVEEFITKNGNGRALLCVAIGKSEATLGRWLKAGIPTAHDAYTLAKACGKSEEDALAFAREECPSEGPGKRAV